MTKLMQQLKTRGTTAERRQIDVSELFDGGDGEPVFARQMTLADREWMMQSMRSAGSGENVVLLPTMKARCRQIVRSLINVDGKRLMTDIDVEGLMKECRSCDIDLIGRRIDAAFPPDPTSEEAEGN